MQYKNTSNLGRKLFFLLEEKKKKIKNNLLTW